MTLRPYQLESLAAVHNRTTPRGGSDMATSPSNGVGGLPTPAISQAQSLPRPRPVMETIGYQYCEPSPV